MSQKNQIHVEEDIRTVTLDNGIVLVTEKIPFLPLTGIGIFNRTGTRHEAPFLNGMAHLFEHSLYDGTKYRSALKVDRSIEKYGGYLNAETSYETIGHYTSCLNNKINTTFKTLAEVVCHPALKKSKFNKTVKTVCQEIGSQLDDPEAMVADMIYELSFKGSPLGEPVLGTYETVKAIQHGDLLDFYQQHYFRSDMIIAAVGSFEHNAIGDLANELFGNLKLKNELLSFETKYKASSSFLNKKQEQVNMQIAYEGYAHGHKDLMTSRLVATAMGNGGSSRLYQKIREKHGYTYDIFANVETLDKAGLIRVEISSDPEDMPVAIPMLQEMLAAAGTTKKFSSEEIIRAKHTLMMSAVTEKINPEARISSLVDDMLYYKRIIPFHEFQNNLNLIKTSDMDRVANEIFSTAPSVAAIGPNSKKLEKYFR